MSASGQYVTCNGVRTYFEVHGQGEPLLLMHGGTLTIESFRQQTPALAERFRVILPERRAHGRTPDVEGPITYDLMAGDTIALMAALSIERAHLVGWSDGANVGMLVALRRPDLVQKLVLISGNFDVSGYTDEFTAFLQQATADTWPSLISDLYKRTSPDGSAHWPLVFEKIKRMWLNEPKIRSQDLVAITAPTLVMCADRDAIKLEHTIDLFRGIPGAQLCVVPGTSHFLPIERPGLVNRVILDFLADDSN